MTRPQSEFSTPAELFGAARAFMRSRVLLSAVELRLFTLLDAGPQSAAELAAELRADARGVDRLLNALVAMGLLAKSAGRFANGDAAARFLVEGKPGYMGGLKHTAHLYRSWATLTDAVRHGGSVMSHGSETWTEEHKEAFIAAMHARGPAAAEATVAALDLARVQRVLDVGGGSGLFSLALARAKAGLRATVFDLPDIVPITRRYVAQEGMSERIDTVAGDYNVDDLPAGFDLVLLSAIVHSCSPAENERLLRKCAAALNPGGQVAVQDHLMSDDRTAPPDGAFFALNMLVNTAGGDTYTFAEIAGWMTAAGLTGVARAVSPAGPGIVVGWKR